MAGWDAMIAQQNQIASRLGSVLILITLVAACATTAEKPQATRIDSGIGQEAAQIALQQVGVPYRYGGQTPSGFDCSGLVHFAYDRAGKAVPRTTAQLWAGTKTVARGNMRAGDLVFFSIDGKMSHVGLYLGDGRFVHAPSTGKTVSVQSLSSPYYRKAFLRAGRPR